MSETDSKRLDDSKGLDCDGVFIDLTKERIEQEISNISADETKSSIIIGVIAAIFGIIFTVERYLSLLLSNVYVWIPIIFLLIAFSCSILVLIPRTRLWLIKPRETNNDYATQEIDELKKTIKKELIENFEKIEKARKYSPWLIMAGFAALIIGTIGIFIAMLIIIHYNL